MPLLNNGAEKYKKLYSGPQGPKKRELNYIISLILQIPRHLDPPEQRGHPNKHPPNKYGDLKRMTDSINEIFGQNLWDHPDVPGEIYGANYTRFRGTNRFRHAADKACLRMVLEKRQSMGAETNNIHYVLLNDQDRFQYNNFFCRMTTTKINLCINFSMNKFLS